MTTNYREGVAYTDGRFVALRDATIPMTDRGFVRSDATYDVAHVWQGRFFRLDDHIDRFFWSMQQLRMSLNLDRGQVRTILEQGVALSGLRDAYVQMTCTRGVPPPGSRDPRACVNRFSAFVQPFVWIATPEQQSAGVKMVVSQVRRIAAEAVDTRIKNFHWLDLTMGIFEAYDRDALISVLLDHEGNVTEGAGFNIFVVKDGALATPDRNVFEGMTRRTVIEMAAQMQLPCAVRPVSPQELYMADEVFATSTAGGIMPVTLIDQRPVGDGLVGSLTQRIRESYWALHEGAQHEASPRCTVVAYEKPQP